MSEESKIMDIDRKVHQLIRQEVELLDKEYKDLLKSIELILHSIRRHEDFHFAASNRKLMLSTLFGLIDSALRLCHKQHELAEEKVYSDFGIQINNLMAALRTFRDALKSGVVASSAEAAGQYTTIVVEPSKKALNSLNEIIGEREKLLKEVLEGSRAA